MKRGLKELPSFQFYPGDWRSRAFPDEEGTESCSLARWSRESSPVPEPSPMKRGLKVSSQMRITRSLPSSRAFPDEEGTESDNLGCGRGWTFRSRAFPDEEGTESQFLRQRNADLSRSRAFPDEEGTERKIEDGLKGLALRFQSLPR